MKEKKVEEKKAEMKKVYMAKKDAVMSWPGGKAVYKKGKEFKGPLSEKMEKHLKSNGII